ncbi:hypothetical protein V6N12_023643 [Hibiscus sabdariffa]|uniref:Uncharacterized protein n=1 Tax=Hibiscus sabdariffa TaxID=183260 RepID=A0ABR2FY98_9ROSI
MPKPIDSMPEPTATNSESPAQTKFDQNNKGEIPSREVPSHEAALSHNCPVRFAPFSRQSSRSTKSRHSAVVVVETDDPTTPGCVSLAEPIHTAHVIINPLFGAVMPPNLEDKHTDSQALLTIIAPTLDEGLSMAQLPTQAKQRKVRSRIHSLQLPDGTWCDDEDALRNDADVRFLDDTWVPSLGPLRHWLRVPYHEVVNLQFGDLLLPSGQWDVDCLEKLLHCVAVPHVIGILPPALDESKDVVVWRGTPTGIFTIASAYARDLEPFVGGCRF